MKLLDRALLSVLDRPEDSIPAEDDLPSRNSALLATVGLAITVVLLGMPFGFHRGWTDEEWQVADRFERKPLIRHASASDEILGSELELGIPLSRPFNVLPHFAAHLISRNSFYGFNLVFALIMLGKAIAVRRLMLQLLPAEHALGFFVAMLFMIYPGDLWYFALRTVAGHLAVLGLLAGTTLLVDLWHRPTVFKLMMMWASIVVSLGIYELGYPLLACAPAVLWWRDPSTSKRKLYLAAAWLIPVGAFFLYRMTVGATVGTAGFQSSIMISGLLSEQAPQKLASMARSVATLYLRLFAVAWIDAVRILLRGGVHLPFAAAIAMLTTGVTACLTGRSSGRRVGQQTDQRTMWMLSIAGAAVVLLGFMVYIPTKLRMRNYSAFYYSSLGAALVLGVVIFALWGAIRRRRLVVSVVAGLVIGLASVNALSELDRWHRRSLAEQRFIKEVAREAPGVSGRAFFVVVGNARTLPSEIRSFVTNQSLKYALRVLYEEHDLIEGGVFCGTSGSAEERPWPGANRCVFDEAGVGVSGGPIYDVFVPYERLVAFEHLGDGRLRLLGALAGGRGAGLYDPDALVDLSAKSPPRVHTLLRDVS